MLFPGQGSQSVGMLDALGAEFPQVAQTFDEASVAVGWDVRALVEHGPEEALKRADQVQPALVAADVAVWRVWQALGLPAPAAMAGHSLGEYAALVCAGALDFADAVRLVEQRGRFMAEAAGSKGGGMAAIIGMADEDLGKLCAAAPAGEMLEPANLNAPGQIVVAASTPALAWLHEHGKEFGARKVVELAMSVPSHCSIMKPAAQKLAAELAKVVFKAPIVPVHHNVDTQPRTDASEIRRALAEQLFNPVRWSQTVAGLVGQGIDTLLECGPARVLGGLNRRIARDAKSYSLEEPEQLRAAADAVRSAA
ncbi:MAG: [acyl-carrier-protein] S-malonyltransferase [Nevskiaceae bacterium]|nr:MAG: [acyl-carrier-protein] S-malonyltransferase [Nevskiaceae bacterium]TBR74897.1 MAG: [acyl-carrier-protein] S-malonyltransferase [Nevskiaceae bacterium]